MFRYFTTLSAVLIQYQRVTDGQTYKYALTDLLHMYAGLIRNCHRPSQPHHGNLLCSIIHWAFCSLDNIERFHQNIRRQKTDVNCMHELSCRSECAAMQQLSLKELRTCTKTSRPIIASVGFKDL